MKKFDFSLIAVVFVMLLSLALGIFLVGVGFLEDTISKDLKLVCICTGFFGIIALSFKYGAFFQDIIRDSDED